MREPMRLLGWTQLQWNYVCAWARAEPFQILAAWRDEAALARAYAIRRDWLEQGGPLGGPNDDRLIVDRYGLQARHLLDAVTSHWRNGEISRALLEISKALYTAEFGPRNTTDNNASRTCDLNQVAQPPEETA